MSKEIIVAQFEVQCDRCKKPIPAGNACWVEMDLTQQKVSFVHIRCNKRVVDKSTKKYLPKH